MSKRENAGVKRQRIDTLLVERGLASSRERAQALLMAGAIRISDQVVSKAGALVAVDAPVTVVADLPFVSRGGLKLQHALASFGIDISGKVVADIGASTGGFTDCLLQAGAFRVYAIDVGYGQLDWKIRQDPRVVVMDRTNIRKVESLAESVDLATVDVSFISLGIVLPAVKRLLKPDGEVVALIKPQFEAGRGRVGKGGVVRDPAVHEDVLRVILATARAAGFVVLGLTRSPITGPAGNVEFLVHLAIGERAESLDETALVRNVVWGEPPRAGLIDSVFSAPASAPPSARTWPCRGVGEVHGADAPGSVLDCPIQPSSD